MPKYIEPLPGFLPPIEPYPYPLTDWGYPDFIKQLQDRIIASHNIHANLISGRKTMNPQRLFNALKQVYPNLVKITKTPKGDIVGVFEHLKTFSTMDPSKYHHALPTPHDFEWRYHKEWPEQKITPKQAFDALKILYPNIIAIRKGGREHNSNYPGTTRIDRTNDLPGDKEIYHDITNIDWGNVTTYAVP